MLPKIEAISKLLPVIEAPSLLASIGTSKQEIVAKISPSALGQQFQGEILAKLSNGQFQIKIAGANLAVNLPNTFQVGEKLTLTLLSISPKLVFQLDGHGRIPIDDPFIEQSIIEQLSYKTKTQNTASQLIHTSTNTGSEKLEVNPYSQTLLKNSKADISDVAKMINQVLSDASKLNSPSVLLNRTPLLNSPSSTPLALSTPNAQSILTSLAASLFPQLNQQITSSGLFYESHVAAWLNGQFNKQDLLKEPQSKTPLFTDISKLSDIETPHRELLTQIIHQQLETNEQQKIAWQGLFFPNAPMEWLIKEEQTKNQNMNAQDEENNAWSSSLKLKLPELGGINIQLNIQNNHLSLAISTQNLDTADLLHAHQLSLKESIQQTGANIQTFSVKYDEGEFNEP